MKKFIFIILTILLFVLPKISLAEGRSIDVTQFDVAGVKLGMTMEQAINAITSSLEVDKSQIKFEPLRLKHNLLLSSTQKKIKKITGSMQISYFSISTKTGKYRVSLLPNVLNGSNEQMVVTSVFYKIPETPENAEIMIKAIQQKYGQPSAQLGGLVLWCLSPEVGACFYGEPQPNLIWNVGILSIRLSDDRYEQAIDNYLNKQKNIKHAF